MRFTIFLAACLCLPFEAVAQPASSQQSSRPGWPCAGKVDPAYVTTAEATGGKVMLFHPTEVEGAALDSRASRAHDETVFRAAGQLAEESYEFMIPIDSTIESAYFVVSVQCLQAVTLMTPSGQELVTGTADVEYHRFEAVRLFVVPRPAPGMWKVTAAGRGFFSMIVTAKTDLSLDTVAFRERGMAEVTMSGSVRQAGFQFVAGNGAPIQAVQLNLEEESLERRKYRGQVVKPRADFRLAVSGLDANGFPFQRMESRLSLGNAPSR
jgi:hypothetical protein